MKQNTVTVPTKRRLTMSAATALTDDDPIEKLNFANEMFGETEDKENSLKHTIASIRLVYVCVCGCVGQRRLSSEQRMEKDAKTAEKGLMRLTGY